MEATTKLDVAELRTNAKEHDELEQGLEKKSSLVASGKNSKVQSRQQSMRIEQRPEEVEDEDFLDSAKKLTSEHGVNHFTPKKHPELFTKAKTILDPSADGREVNVETKPRSKRHFQKKVSLYSQTSSQRNS